MAQFEGFYQDVQGRLNDMPVAACSEFGFAASKQLQHLNENVLVVSLSSEKSPLNIHRTSGHVVCLLGVDDITIEQGDFSLTGAKKSWGKQFIVVDPWSNDAYPIDQVSENKPSLKLTKESIVSRSTRAAVKTALDSGNVSVLHARPKKNSESRLI